MPIYGPEPWRELRGVTFNHWPVVANRLNTYCNLYDRLAAAGGPNSVPSMRSAVMVHEGTHGWWRKLGTFGGNCGGHHCANEFADKGGP